jgi:lactoylglutathione lyase
MKIEHVAYWVKDLEKMKRFYQDYFGGRTSELYHNPQKEFRSYFISFSSGARLELMHSNHFEGQQPENIGKQLGITHLAFSAGSKDHVNALTERLNQDGYQVLGKPRTTGDGYYESVVLDPELNKIEITV